MSVLLRLIKAVKSHPKLFTNSGQNDDNFLEWTAVAEECKITTSEAQNQWNLLLMEYVEYLRNNQDFDLAQDMDFLQPHFFTINYGETIDEDELLNAIGSTKNSEKKGINLGRTENEEQTVKASFDMENKHKIERITKVDMSSATCNQKKQSIDPESNHQSSSFTNLSSLELIFLGYAKQLEKMPQQLQLKTKRKIADIMEEAELQMMN